MRVITDTVQVTITGETTLQNQKPATVWEYTYSNKKDTHYVSLFNDTLFFYTDEIGSGMLYFILPLQVGNSWGNPNNNFTVISRVNMRTPAGTFRNVFHIHREYFQPNVPGSADYWISSESGIVKLIDRVFSTIEMENRHSYYTLISVKLAR